MATERRHWLSEIAGGTATAPLDLSAEELALAYRHGLVGLLADPGLPYHVPSAIPPFLRLAARQQVMRRHLRTLLERFEQDGIPVTVLKGPLLADAFYTNPMHRTFTDLDLLVRRVDLDRALKLLASYTHISSLPLKRPAADKREVAISDPSGVTFALDLHWDLFSYRQLLGGAGDASEEAWRSARFNPESSVGPVWELPMEAHVAFLCCHAVLDHRFRLILFRDLAEAARTGVDWEAVAHFATRHRLRSFTYLALSITRELAGGLVPEKFVAELRPLGLALRAAERMIHRIDLTTFNGHRPHPLNLAIVLLHDEWSGRARLLLRAPFALFGWWGRVRRLRAQEDGPSAMIVVVGTHRRGAEVFGEQLARGLLASGWRCELVALTKNNTGPEIAAHPLSKLADQRLSGLRLGLVLRLRRSLRSSGAQVVLANGSATLKYTAAALIGMRARPAFVYASVGEPSYWVTNRWRRIAQRYLLSRADLVVAVSRPTARQLVDDIGVAPERVTVAHTGVSSDLLALPTRTPEEDFHVLVLGSLSTEKDPEAALAIFVSFLKTHRARLRFVGAGPLQGRLTEAASGESVDGTVELVGSAADVGPHLAWADVLLLTSRTEGLPGAVLEAAAAGVSAVGYAVGGVEEAIEDMQTGLVVPAGDQQAAVAALAQLADDPELRLRLGQSARRRVAREFLLADAVTRYRTVLESAILTRRKQ